MHEIVFCSLLGLVLQSHSMIKLTTYSRSRPSCQPLFFLQNFWSKDRTLRTSGTEETWTVIVDLLLICAFYHVARVIWLVACTPQFLDTRTSSPFFDKGLENFVSHITVNDLVTWQWHISLVYPCCLSRTLNVAAHMGALIRSIVLSTFMSFHGHSVRIWWRSWPSEYTLLKIDANSE